MASSDIPMQIAETIQTAHIKREPSAAHDLAPSTAADTKEPVELEEKSKQVSTDAGVDGDQDDDEIPVSVLRPRRRFSHLPPIPSVNNTRSPVPLGPLDEYLLTSGGGTNRDLRFEQSYLHSIQDAKSWSMVAWITAKDQIMMPMVQGVVYNLAWCGWQHWNRNAQMSGNTIGARVRRWWYSVNNWRVDGKPPVGNEKKAWF